MTRWTESAPRAPRAEPAQRPGASLEPGRLRQALLRENMDLGRPDNIEVLFRRGQPKGRPAIPPARGLPTAIDQHCAMVTLNVFYKNSRVRQYLKDGIALRIETVVNSLS